VRRYLRNPTFCRFDTIPECDGHTHTHTHTHTDTRRRHIPLLARRRAVKNETIVDSKLRPWCRRIFMNSTKYYSCLPTDRATLPHAKSTISCCTPSIITAGNERRSIENCYTDRQRLLAHYVNGNLPHLHLSPP